MKRKSIIFLVIFVLLIVGIVLYFSVNTKNRTTKWRTATVEKGDIIITVTATGSINADTTVQVGTQVSGRISKLFADFNSIVKKGQIIAILDTTLLAADKEDALANLERAQVQVAESKLQYDRNKKLFDEKVISKAEFDLVVFKHETNRSVYKSAKAQLKLAKINLEYATIRAPVSGTVISRSVDIGQTVIANFNTPTLFTIANDLSKMQVQANIDEADIGQVKIGQKVEFTVDAYPEIIFQGTVKQIRLQPVIMQNVVTYIVIIDVPNPDLKLMPGLTANTTIKITEHKDVLKIPANALNFIPPEEYFENAQIPDSIKKQWNEIKESLKKKKISLPDTALFLYVWIPEGKYVYPKKLKKGIADETSIEVSGNIREGTEIIIGVREENNNASSPAQNPFIPKFPSRKKT